MIKNILRIVMYFIIPMCILVYGYFNFIYDDDDYNKIEKTPVSFFDSKYKSYYSVELVKHQLIDFPKESIKLTSRKSDPNRTSPSYDFDTIYVDGYKYMEKEGRVEFSFFNNRLYYLTFCPNDFKEFDKVFKVEKEKFTIEAMNDSNLDFGIRVKCYFWVEKRLLEQIGRWERYYSNYIYTEIRRNIHLWA